MVAIVQTFSAIRSNGSRALPYEGFLVQDSSPLVANSNLLARAPSVARKAAISWRSASVLRA
jgi:hypothetical protein